MKISTIRHYGVLLMTLFTLTAAQGQATAPSHPPRFPLRASANGRFIVDARNKPFFYQADTPWLMFLKMTVPEAAEYMDARQAQGFSALQVMLIADVGMKNRDGLSPFDGDNDFAKPNEAYFAHVDAIVQKAADKGMLLMIAPLWSGCCGDGWAGKGKDGKLRPLNLNGPEKAHEWGRWLGKRYGRFNNIAWLLGGDRNPDESFELICRLARGIHETAPQQLMAVHNAPGNTSAAFYDDEPWLTLDATYTYEEVFNHIHGEWNRTKHVRPIFLAESGYEHEQNDGRPGTPFRVRRQAYEAVLSGALGGEAFGHRDLWPIKDNWRKAIRDTGSAQMAFVPQLFASHSWWKLLPEAGTEFVTQGRGTVGNEDYVTAARAADGSLAMVYIPQSRAVTVDLTKLKGHIKASWFDPTDGSLKAIQKAGFKAESHEFLAPGKNAGGDSDWVLLLETKR